MTNFLSETLSKTLNTTANAIRRAAKRARAYANAIAATTAMTATMTATITIAMMAAMIAMTTATANAQTVRIIDVDRITSPHSSSTAADLADPGTTPSGGITTSTALHWRVTFNVAVRNITDADFQLFRVGDNCADDELGDTITDFDDFFSVIEVPTSAGVTTAGTVYDVTARMPFDLSSISPPLSDANEGCIVLGIEDNPALTNSRFYSGIEGAAGGNPALGLAPTSTVTDKVRHVRPNDGTTVTDALPTNFAYTFGTPTSPPTPTPPPAAGSTRITTGTIPSNIGNSVYQMSRTTSTSDTADPGGTGVGNGDTIHWRVRFGRGLKISGSNSVGDNDFAVYRLSAANCSDPNAAVGTIVASATASVVASISGNRQFNVTATLPDPIPSANVGDCLRLGFESTATIQDTADGDLTVDAAADFIDRSISRGTNPRRFLARPRTGGTGVNITYVESDQFYTFGTPSTPGPTTPPTTLPALTGTVTSDATAVTATFAADADITNPSTTIVAGDFAVMVGGTAFSGTVNVGSPAARSFTLTFNHGLTPQDAGNDRDIEISLTTQGGTKYTLASALTHSVADTTPELSVTYAIDAANVVATFTATPDIADFTDTGIVDTDFEVSIGGAAALASGVTVGSRAADGFTLTFAHGLNPAGGARSVTINLSAAGQGKYRYASGQPVAFMVPTTAPTLTVAFTTDGGNITTTFTASTAVDPVPTDMTLRADFELSVGGTLRPVADYTLVTNPAATGTTFAFTTTHGLDLTATGNARAVTIALTTAGAAKYVLTTPDSFSVPRTAPVLTADYADDTTNLTITVSSDVDIPSADTAVAADFELVIGGTVTPVIIATTPAATAREFTIQVPHGLDASDTNRLVTLRLTTAGAAKFLSLSPASYLVTGALAIESATRQDPIFGTVGPDAAVSYRVVFSRAPTTAEARNHIADGNFQLVIFTNTASGMVTIDQLVETGADPTPRVAADSTDPSGRTYLVADTLPLNVQTLSNSNQMVGLRHRSDRSVDWTPASSTAVADTAVISTALADSFNIAPAGTRPTVASIAPVMSGGSLQVNEDASTGTRYVSFDVDFTTTTDSEIVISQQAGSTFRDGFEVTADATGMGTDPTALITTIERTGTSSYVTGTSNEYRVTVALFGSDDEAEVTLTPVYEDTTTMVLNPGTSTMVSAALFRLCALNTGGIRRCIGDAPASGSSATATVPAAMASVPTAPQINSISVASALFVASDDASRTALALASADIGRVAVWSITFTEPVDPLARANVTFPSGTTIIDQTTNISGVTMAAQTAILTNVLGQVGGANPASFVGFVGSGDTDGLGAFTTWSFLTHTTGSDAQTIMATIVDTPDITGATTGMDLSDTTTINDMQNHSNTYDVPATSSPGTATAELVTDVIYNAQGFATGHTDRSSADITDPTALVWRVEFTGLVSGFGPEDLEATGFTTYDNGITEIIPELRSDEVFPGEPASVYYVTVPLAASGIPGAGVFTGNTAMIGIRRVQGNDPADGGVAGPGRTRGTGPSFGTAPPTYTVMRSPGGNPTATVTRMNPTDATLARAGRVEWLVQFDQAVANFNTGDLRVVDITGHDPTATGAVNRAEVVAPSDVRISAIGRTGTQYRVRATIPSVNSTTGRLGNAVARDDYTLGLALARSSTAGDDIHGIASTVSGRPFLADLYHGLEAVNTFGETYDIGGLGPSLLAFQRIPSMSDQFTVLFSDNVNNVTPTDFVVTDAAGMAITGVMVTGTAGGDTYTITLPSGGYARVSLSDTNDIMSTTTPPTALRPSDGSITRRVSISTLSNAVEHQDAPGMGGTYTAQPSRDGESSATSWGHVESVSWTVTYSSAVPAPDAADADFGYGIGCVLRTIAAPGLSGGCLTDPTFTVEPDATNPDTVHIVTANIISASSDNVRYTLEAGGDVVDTTSTPATAARAVVYIDNRAPEAIELEPDAADTTAMDGQDYLVTFDSPVTRFGLGNIFIDGTTAMMAQVTTLPALVSPAPAGTPAGGQVYRFTVAAASAMSEVTVGPDADGDLGGDVAGNPIVDGTAPDVVSMSDNRVWRVSSVSRFGVGRIDGTNLTGTVGGDSVGWRVTFNERVREVSASDFLITATMGTWNTPLTPTITPATPDMRGETTWTLTIDPSDTGQDMSVTLSLSFRSTSPSIFDAGSNRPGRTNPRGTDHPPLMTADLTPNDNQLIIYGNQLGRPRVTSFDIMGTGNDFTVVFSKPVGGIEADNFVITDFNDNTDTEMVASATAVSPTNGRATDWTVTISGADTGYVLVAFSNEFRDIVDEDGLSLASRPTETASRSVNVSNVSVPAFIRRTLDSDPDTARADPTMRSYMPIAARNGLTQANSAGYVERINWTVNYATPVPTPGTTDTVNGIRLAVAFDYQVMCSNAESTTDRNMAVATADEVACGSASISSDTSSNMMHVVTARGLRTSNFINYTLTTGMGNTVSSSMMGVMATTPNAVVHLDTRAPRLIGLNNTTPQEVDSNNMVTTPAVFHAFFDETVTGLDGMGMVPNPDAMTRATTPMVMGFANFRINGFGVVAGRFTVADAVCSSLMNVPSGAVSCFSITAATGMDPLEGSLSLVTSYDGMGARDAAGNPISGVSRTLIQVVQTAVTQQLQQTVQAYIANTPALVGRISRVSDAPRRAGTAGATRSGNDPSDRRRRNNFAFDADNDSMRFGYENDSRTQSFTYTSTDTTTNIDYDGVLALSSLSGGFADGLELWAQGTYSASENSLTNSESTAFFLHTGIDREIKENVVAGVMLQIDSSEANTMSSGGGASATDVSTSGWMIGPYLAASGVRYSLSMETRIAFGQASNELTATGVAGSTTYDSSRLAASIGMSGIATSMNMFSSIWDMSPSFQYDYFTTESDAHMLGTTSIPSSEYTLNRFTFGPTFSSVYSTAGGTMSPSFTFAGLIDDASVTEGVDLGTSSFSARIDANVDFANRSGFNWNAGMYFDGLGSDTTGYGLTGGLRIDF